MLRLVMSWQLFQAYLNSTPEHRHLIHPLNELYPVFDAPNPSEFVNCLSIYLQILEALPSWSDLPFSRSPRTLVELREVLTREFSPQFTAQIDTTHSHKRYPIWTTLLSVKVHHPDALTGLLAITLLLQTQQPDLAKELASALRGRNLLGELPTDSPTSSPRATLNDILTTTASGSSPPELIQTLRDSEDAIKHAKPHFLQILKKLAQSFKDVPDEIELQYPQLFTTIGSDQADSPDEDAPHIIQAFYADLLEPPSTSANAQRERFERSIWSRNFLNLEGHVSALTLAEAQEFVTWASQRAENLLAHDEPAPATAYLVAILAVITGRPIEVCTPLLRAALGKQPADSDRYIDLATGALTLKAPRPPAAFDPSPNQASRLLPSQDHFTLALPPTYVLLASKLRNAISRTAPEPGVNDSLRIAPQFCAQQSRDFSWGRATKWLATRVMTGSNDPAIACWITGDLQGKPPGFLYYARVPSSELASIYARAVWPLFGDEIAKLPKQKTAVGSRAVPEPKYIAGSVRKLNRAFAGSKISKRSPSAISRRHNLLVNYLLSMLMAVTGHRPSSAILDLKRGDFLLSLNGEDWLGVANYQDKRSDEAHMLRPVPLGSHVAEQIGLFLLHLEALESALVESASPAASIRTTKKALTGDAPLFFHLNETLQAESMSFPQWHMQFSATFADLPTNFGRHFLAHIARSHQGDAGDAESGTVRAGGGELACLINGHFSVLGDPYGPDSPTTIRDMAADAGAVVDRVYELQAWERRGGLARPPKRFQPKHLATPHHRLRSWDLERKQLHRTIEQRKKRIAADQTQKFNESEQRVRSGFLHEIGKRQPGLAEQLRNLDALEPSEIKTFSLTRGQLSAALSAPASSAPQTEAARANDMWVRLRLARALLKAAKQLGVYEGPLPSRVFQFQTLEQTPLLSSMYIAFDTLMAMRSSYEAVIANDNISAVPPNLLYSHLAVSCILLGQVYELSVLHAIVDNAKDCVNNPQHPDSVLIELHTHPPKTWALFGLPALLAAKIRQAQPASPPPAKEELHAQIKRLPVDFLDQHRTAHGLEQLLEVAALAAVVDLSGLGRTALGTDPATASWCLPLSRQIPLLTGDFDSTTVPATRSPSIRRSAVRHGPDVRSDWYQFLLDEMPSASVKQSHTEEQAARVETHRRQRRPYWRKIKSEQSRRQLTELERAIGRWIRQMLLSIPLGRKTPLKMNSIYTYLTSIGGALLRIVGDQRLCDIEEDEWAEIYSRILAGYKDGTLNRKLLQIRRLHRIMETRFGTAPLSSMCLPAGATIEPNVRTSAALPSELSASLETLMLTRYRAQQVREHERLSEVAELALMLLCAAPCRPGEITALQHRDIQFFKDSIYLRIRINLFKEQKTPAASRLIQIQLSDEQTQRLRSFLEAEKLRLGRVHFRPSRLIFIDLKGPVRGNPLPPEALRSFFSGALRQSSPLPLIGYDIRKMHGIRLQAEMALSDEPTRGIGGADLPLQLPGSPPEQLRLPRCSASRACVHGNARARTLNHHYGLLPWVYLIPPVTIRARALTPDVISSILGRNPESTRRLAPKNPAALGGWCLQRVAGRQRRTRTPSRATQVMPLQIPRRSDLADAMVYLCNANTLEAENSFASYGLTPTDYQALTQSALLMLEESRFQFLPSLSGQIADRPRAAAMPRWSRQARDLLQITHGLSNPIHPIWDIAAEFRLTVTPDQKQSTIILLQSRADQLKELISGASPRIQVLLRSVGARTQVMVGKDGKLNRSLAWILLAVEVLRPIYPAPNKC